MRTWTAERLGAAAGIGFLVLNVIANLIPGGSAPSPHDHPAKIARYFVQHHRSIAIAVILTGIAAPLLAWLVATVALRLRALGEGTWAVIVFALGVIAIALGAGADAISGALIRTSVAHSDRVTQGLYQLQGYLTVKSFWFAAGLALTVGLAALRVLPRWYAWVSLAAAVLVGIGGLTVKGAGFFSPLQGMTAISFVALLVWILLTSIVFWRLAPEAEPRRQAVPTPA